MNDNVKAAITLNPKHMEYDSVKPSKIELALQKGVTIARYSFMNSEDDIEDIDQKLSGYDHKGTLR